MSCLCVLPCLSQGVERFAFKSQEIRIVEKCDKCGQLQIRLRRCSKCKAKLYCSEECQVRETHPIRPSHHVNLPAAFSCERWG